MTVGTIDHEEAVIRSYMRDPEFAEYMLHMAVAGDIAEAQKVQRRMLEALRRTRKEEYAFLKDIEIQIAIPAVPV